MKTLASLSNYLILLLTPLLLLNCKKEEITTEGTNGFNSTLGISSGALITSSIGGTIVDSNNQPIEGVLIRIGYKTAFTNSTGNFLIKDVIVDKERAYITATKSGYFKGSRAIIPSESGISSIVIQLIHEMLAGSFDNSTGGNIQLPGGAGILFNPGDVSLEDGTPYSGIVQVYASNINPVGNNFLEVMPGDFLGKDDSGNVVGLESFGMLNIELKSSNGEALNITPGNVVQLTCPIPTSLQSNAPSSIPLWFFDETAGNWVEDGQANLQGIEYVGNISHLTILAYCYPLATTTLSLSLECNGSQLYFMGLRATDPTATVNFGSGATWDGEFEVTVPSDQPLKLEFTDVCDQLVHSINIGIVGNAPLDLGVIEICNGISSSQFSATLINCNNAPVTNGALVATLPNGVSLPFFTDNNGNVQGNFIMCPTDSVFISGYNFDDANQSLSMWYPLTPNANFGTINTCSPINEYLDFHTDTSQHFFIPTTVSDVYSIVNGSNIEFIGSNYGSSQHKQRIQFTIDATGAGTYGNLGSNPFATSNYPFDLGLYYYYTLPQLRYQFYGQQNGITVNLTNYAPGPGSYFEGTFDGQIQDSIQQNIPIHGSFRIRRDQ